MKEYWNWSQVDLPARVLDGTFVWHSTNHSNNAAIVNGNLQLSAGATSNLNIFRRAVNPIPTDCEVVTTMKLSVTDGSSTYLIFPTILLRSNTNDTFTGYRFNLSATGDLVVRKTTNLNDTPLGTYPIPNVTADSWVNIRARAQGTAIRAKAWLAGTAEPTEWSIDVVDSSFASGRLGILTWNKSVIVPYVIGPLSIATDGDTAAWHEKTTTGRVVDTANPANGLSRRVVAFERDTMAHIRSTVSDANGYFKLTVPTDRVCTVVVFDANGGTKNAKIVDRIGGA